MIKWIRAFCYHGHTDERKTGHIFRYRDKMIQIDNLKAGEYPPFDCLVLSHDDAIKLRDFLNKALSQ